LNAFVSQLAAGQPAEAAFASALGSIDDYDRAFTTYVNRSIYSGIRIKVDAGLDRERFPVRPMPAAEAALARASFHTAMGRAAEARTWMGEAAKIDPQAAGASGLEALLLEREGQMAEAKVAYDKAVSLGSTNPYVLFRSAVLAWPDAEGAALEQVEKNLAKAVEFNPLFARAHATLAEVRAQLKRPQNTIVTHMQKAVQLEPSEPWHRISAARVLGRLNAFEEARKAAASALKLAGDDERARAEAQRLLAMFEGR
jgi:tetratricopeptide (TPR) repeat protein